MRKIILTALILLLIFNSASVFAQTMRSKEFQLQIKDLDFKLTDVTPTSPQPPKDFKKNGFIINKLSPDTKISKPFFSDPAAYLIRAKPGTNLTSPITIHNFKNPLVLDLKLIPFNLNSASECATAKISHCKALLWFSIDKERILLEIGEKKKINLRINISEEAQEGDYYIKLYLSEFNKPYNYTSTDYYITITNSGLISHNISLSTQSFPLIINSGETDKFSLQLTNGSPYFDTAILKFTFKSPIGFSKKEVLKPIILSANQSLIFSPELKSLPLGPLRIKISVENMPSAQINRWVFALPSL